jgi:hypothetical protein
VLQTSRTRTNGQRCRLALTFGSGDFRRWLYELSNHDTRLTRDRLTVFVSHLCRLGTNAQVDVLSEPLNSAEAPVWNSLEAVSHHGREQAIWLPNDLWGLESRT